MKNIKKEENKSRDPNLHLKRKVNRDTDIENQETPTHLNPHTTKNLNVDLLLNKQRDLKKEKSKKV